MRKRLFFWQRRRDELNEEIESHLKMAIRERIERGELADQAEIDARREFGNVALIKDVTGDVWGWRWLERLLEDIRFGFRVLAKNPGFTAVAVLTLAIGIGAASTIFSVVDAVVLHPYDYPRPDRLAVVWETNPPREISQFSCSSLNLLSWREAQTSFAELGGIEFGSENRTDGEVPENVHIGRASASLLRTLGQKPVLGRYFSDSEDVPANRYVAVLGYEYWQHSFHGGVGVLGRVLTMNGERYTIVGVAPPMRRPLRVDLWRPLAPEPASLDRGNHMLFVVGRLKDGVEIEAAQADLKTIAAQLEAQYPKTNEGWSVRVEPLYDAVVEPETQRGLTVLLAAVGLLLLIGCANIANLLVARSTGRSREMAVRQVLGAGRARLIRQLLTESVILAVVGGTAGVLLAIWGVDWVRFLHPGEMPGLEQAHLNGRVLAFAVSVTLATAVLFGLGPALATSGSALEQSLRESGRGNTAPVGHRRLRQLLVVGEIALAMVLLTGAGLLLTSFERLQNVPLGFTPAHVLTVKMNRPEFDGRQAFFDRVQQAVEGVPGVRAVGFTSNLPFDGFTSAANVRPEGEGDQPNNPGIQMQWRIVGGDYFGALGIPLLRGRAFDERDGEETARPVTVINEELANRLWPGEDPVGRVLLLGDGRNPREVVGVTGGVRDLALTGDVPFKMYLPNRQSSFATMTMAVRTTGEPEGMAAAIRSAVGRVAPAQPLYDVRPMRALIDDASAGPRLNAGLLGFFAFVALLLAAIGIFGVMSYVVEQRTNEIGIRLALGARPANVLRMVVGQGVRWAAAGITIGLVGALAGGRVLASLLFEVSPTDPATFTVVVLVLAAVTILACLVPARRAMRVDAMTALRHE